MAVSMEDVRALLEPDEPKYRAVPALGAEAVPHLEALIAGDDPLLASKAVYAASLLEGALGVDAVLAGAQSEDVTVRVAAAAAAQNLPSAEASSVLLDLVEEEDSGVRKVALSSAQEVDPSSALAERLESLESIEDDVTEPVDLSNLHEFMPSEARPVDPTQEGPSGGDVANGLMPGEQPLGEAATGLMPGETAP